MLSMDSVKARKIKIQVLPKAPLKQPKKVSSGKGTQLNLLSFFDSKQIITIVITFIVTFIFSIGTSQGLASHSNNFSFEKDTSQNNTTQILYSSSNLAVTDIPTFVELTSGVIDQPREVHLPKENLNLPDPLQKRKEFLEKYLAARKSPLANHVDAISEQSQWKLIIAIARAESSFCKRFRDNNCWGIGGAWNLKTYKNYDEAVADVNRILERYYISAGLDTPKKIVRKYVGHQSDNWELAVQQELDNLKNVE